MEAALVGNPKYVPARAYLAIELFKIYDLDGAPDLLAQALAPDPRNLLHLFSRFRGKSGVMHTVGRGRALAGAMVLGPRLGKFNRDGSLNTIPGHNLILAITGCFILAFGWFGFNPGSTLDAAGNGSLRIGIIAVDSRVSCSSR